MLPRKNRVGTELFTDILKDSRTFHSQHFYLRTRKETACDLKFSAVVSKKIQKTAVGRNKLKRRMREAIAEIVFKSKEKAVSVSLNTSLNILFAKKGAELLDIPLTRLEIQSLWQQAHK